MFRSTFASYSERYVQWTVYGWEVTIKCMKLCTWIWTGFIWLEVGTSGLLWVNKWNSCYLKMWGNSLVHERVVEFSRRIVFRGVIIIIIINHLYARYLQLYTWYKPCFWVYSFGGTLLLQFRNQHPVLLVKLFTTYKDKITLTFKVLVVPILTTLLHVSAKLYGHHRVVYKSI